MIYPREVRTLAEELLVATEKDNSEQARDIKQLSLAYGYQLDYSPRITNQPSHIQIRKVLKCNH